MMYLTGVIPPDEVILDENLVASWTDMLSECSLIDSEYVALVTCYCV